MKMESPSCWRRICKTLYSICVYAYLCMCVMSVCSRLCHYATHQSLSQLLLWRYAKVIICSTLKGIKCGGSANKLGNNSKLAYMYVCLYLSFTCVAAKGAAVFKQNRLPLNDCHYKYVYMRTYTYICIYV